MTAEEIERAAHDFLTNGKGVDVQHNYKKTNVDIVESWVAKDDTDINGQRIKKGTWIATAKINDDLIWKAIKDEEITGFSMGGTGIRINKTKEEKNMLTIEEIKKAFAEAIEKGNEIKEIEELKTKIEVLEKAAENRNLTEEEKKKIAEQDKEIKELKETLNKMDGIIREMSSPTNINKAEVIEKAEQEYSAAIRKATLADGESIVPKPLANEMIKDMKEIAPFFADGKHLQAKGTSLTIPVRLPNEASSAQAKKEGKETTKGGINLKKIVLHKGVVQSIIPITDELRRDASFNIAGLVKEYSAEDVGEYIAINTVKGEVDTSNADSINRIKGFQKDIEFMSERTEEQKTANVIDYKELLNIKRKLKQSYRKGAKWYISPEAEFIMQSMEDKNGRPLWIPSLIDGTPDKFLGYPVVVMEQMGEEAGDVMVLFANFQKFYYYLVDYEFESEKSREATAGYDDEILRTRLGGQVANKFAAYGIKKKGVQ